MRIAVTGRTGQVAMSLAVRARQMGGIDLLALGRPVLDLENPTAAKAAILAARPDFVVNTAAYTAVDAAETDRERAFAINRDGARAVAEAAAELEVPLIHLSTDYVFDGMKPTPYVEPDATAPLNVYGLSKRDGEAAVLAAHPFPIIFRTSWVFSAFGSNFVKTMLRIGAERQSLRIVNDQIGNPTSADDIAEMVLRIAPGIMSKRPVPGIYHLTNTGSTSWFGLARVVFEECARHGGPRPVLTPISAADYPTPARRPANSRLDCGAFNRSFGCALRPWQDAVAETVNRLMAVRR